MSQRRASGDGSVYQRKDGRWCASIDLGYVNGKRTRKTIYGKTQKEVTDKKRQLQQELAQGRNLTVKKTVKDFLTTWLEETIKPDARPKTYSSYEYVVRTYLIPHLGRIALEKLTPEDVQRMVNALRRQEGQPGSRAEGQLLSPRTVQYTLSVLTRALNRALKFSYVTRNVAALVDAPRVEKYEATILTPDQARRLLEAVNRHRLESLYRIALGLGLRMGEIIALAWRDVDLDNATLHIRESKTETGKRTLWLPLRLVTALRAHWAFQQQERLAQGLNWKEHGLVFPSEVGTPLLHRNLHRHFKQTLRKAGLPDMRFHDLRHSCASLLVAQGEHPRTVMHVLRHANIQMSMDVYAKVFPEMEREALEKLDQLLNDGS